MIRKISLDEGFGGFKLGEATNGAVDVVTIPAVVGVGETDVGLLSLGGNTRRGRRHQHPLRVMIDSKVTYLVGDNVHRYARPVERLDFQRLSDGPELRALLYAGLARLLGPGQHEIGLVVGLPVELMQDRSLAQATLRQLRSWLVGEHHFQVDKDRLTVTIIQVRAMA